MMSNKMSDIVQYNFNFIDKFIINIRKLSQREIVATDGSKFILFDTRQF